MNPALQEMVQDHLPVGIQVGHFNAVMPAKNAWNARQSWGHKPGIELIKANQQGTIHKAASKNHEGPNCTPVIPVAQNSTENSGTSPSSDLLPELKGKWQQRPETSALIRRIHTSSSHHSPHQCSVSAEKWIRPGSNHPSRRRTAPPTTPVDASSTEILVHSRASSQP